MRKLLLATTALLALSALPAKADIVTTGTFTSDHCTGGCGPQSPGFATVTVTDNQAGTLTFDFTLLNGNRFANGGQQVTFGFNLIDNPTITYSGLNTSLFTVVNGTGAGGLTQNAGSLSGDGLGNFEYGVDGLFNGANTVVTALHFSITGTGLDITDLNELSTTPPGNMPAIMGLDLFSGTTGNTGFVDLSTFSTPAVPEPATWAMMILGFLSVGGVSMLGRRREGRAFRLA